MRIGRFFGHLSPTARQHRHKIELSRASNFTPTKSCLSLNSLSVWRFGVVTPSKLATAPDPGHAHRRRAPELRTQIFLSERHGSTPLSQAQQLPRRASSWAPRPSRDRGLSVVRPTPRANTPRAERRVVVSYTMLFERGRHASASSRGKWFPSHRTQPRDDVLLLVLSCGARRQAARAGSRHADAGRDDLVRCLFRRAVGVRSGMTECQTPSIIRGRCSAAPRAHSP